MAARFELLVPRHDRKAFDCGVDELNHYLQRVARQHQEHGASQVFVMVDEQLATPSRVLGYFTLSSTKAESESLPPEIAKRLPRMIPAVLLGRLAVDREFQGRGFGTALLFEALRRVAVLRPQVGLCGLFVDAKDDSAAQFYRRNEFISLITDAHRLFLPIKTILELVQQINPACSGNGGGGSRGIASC